MKSKKKQIRNIREVLEMVIIELRRQGIVSRPFMDEMLAHLNGKKPEE